MSSKFKPFTSLSERHKRRRLTAMEDRSKDFESTQISALQPAPSVSGNEIRIQDCNDENENTFGNEIRIHDSSDENENTSGTHEEVENSEVTEEEEEEEEKEEEEDDEEEGAVADYSEAQNNMEEEYMSNALEGENNCVPQNLDQLKRTALKNAFLAVNLKHTQGNALLATLREFPFNIRCLPKDTRTLLQTPTNVVRREIQQIAGGEYLHLGVKYTLVKKLKSLPEHMLSEVIEIDFSTDGAQIHKSGTCQFWPIQYRIFNCFDKRPVIAGIFKGTQKPSNTFQFFEQFTNEIINIHEEGGVLIRNRRLPLKIRCFIADAPARAFALNHFGHTSSNACSKCKVEGHRCEGTAFFTGTMVFPGIHHPPRTDDQYRDMIDEDHHKGASPLSPLIGLVTQVPFEAMHLVYLGIVKKILHTHLAGKYGKQKLNTRKVEILDSRMIDLQVYCPSEFNRRPNKFSMFCHFKSTEFRQFLLYTAPVVLQNVLHEEYYEHFVLLHFVMRLLSLENVPDSTYIWCKEALKSYVSLCEKLYGEQFLSYNVHGLLHVVDDVARLGPLDSYSAFCYENNMPQFRKYIRKPHLALEQFYNRMCELNDIVLVSVDNTIQIHAFASHTEGPLLQYMPSRLCRQFRKLTIGNITFSTSLRDNCCIQINGEICIIQNIIQMEERTIFIVKKFRTQVYIYDVGRTSDFAGVFQCSNLSNALEAINLTDVKRKMYRMPKWSSQEGQEERVLENIWICVSLITPLVLP